MMTSIARIFRRGIGNKIILYRLNGNKRLQVKRAILEVSEKKRIFAAENGAFTRLAEWEIAGFREELYNFADKNRNRYERIVIGSTAGNVALRDEQRGYNGVYKYGKECGGLSPGNHLQDVEALPGGGACEVCALGTGRTVEKKTLQGVL